jgi:hypothetical protein
MAKEFLNKVEKMSFVDPKKRKIHLFLIGLLKFLFQMGWYGYKKKFRYFVLI